MKPSKRLSSRSPSRLSCGTIFRMLRLVSTLLLASAALFAADRPNIVVLFADDQRVDTIGAWGNPHIETPNIDNLVANGFSFKGNYCMGSFGGAVCVPSRAMLNTGKAFFRIPMDMSGEQTLGELMGEAGYNTFGTGKWHNQRPSWRRSFQKGKTIMFGGMSDHTNVPIDELGPDGKLRSAGFSRVFSSELFANSAIEFINGHSGDDPFYVYVAFTSPHDPRQPPKRLRDYYYDWRNRPPLPPNFLPQHPFNNGNMAGRDEELGAWPRTRSMVSDQLAEYYGMVTHLDEQVGRVVAALEHKGLLEDTIIIYAADHGLAVGSHGLLGKQSVYEHSMRAPLIVSGPGVPKGGSTSALTYLLDIFPTILRLGEAEEPNGLDGEDLRSIWEGKAERVRDTLFLSYAKVMRAVRDQRWKMIRYPHINHTQLFDLENDPHEMTNLAEEEDQKNRVASLTAEMERWQKHLGDTQPLTSENPIPMDIDMTNIQRSPDKWQPMWIIEKYFPKWF